MSFFKKFGKKKSKAPKQEAENGNAPAAASSGFDAEADCEVLKKAMKGLGTDEDDLIAVLCKRNGEERRQIAEKFRELYSKELAREIEKETSGDLKLVLSRLSRDPHEMAAIELNESIKDGAKDRQAIVEVICTRSCEDVAKIRQKYTEKFGEYLEKDLGKTGEKNDQFRRLLVAILCASSDATKIDESMAKTAASKLKDGPGDDGENRFDDLLATRSFPQVQATFRAYEKDNGDIDDAFKSEFCNEISADLFGAMFAMRNKQAYLATRLYDSLKGAGTKDTMLIRLITSRADIDLDEIKQEYLRLYTRSLAKDVASDTSGDYKKALLTLLGEE